MKIRIMCSRCKSDSLLVAKPILNLEEAGEVIRNISEVVERHRTHTNDLDFYLFDAVEDDTTQRFIFDSVRKKIDG